MVLINEEGYFIKTKGMIKYDWWLGKPNVPFKNIVLPEEYWGKRVRFKVEVIE